MTSVKKISISLPEELCRELDRIARENGSSRSAVIANILRLYLGKEDEERHPDVYPTALRKLKDYGLVKLRSPRLAKIRIRSDWIIEPEL